VPRLDTISIERLSEGAVLFLYNQPKIANAFTLRQWVDMRVALEWARDEPEIKVIVQYVLTRSKAWYTIYADMFLPRGGKGKHYSAGTLIGYPKILVAAVHGASIGWGCTQLFNFDLVYAHPSAFFQTPFVSLGIVPEGASSYSFPKVMGRQHANRLLVEGDRIPAQDMYVSGLVTKVIESGSVEEFHKAVCAKAKKIAENSAESLRLTKKLV
ncbi:ClpP/crotonase, partial [Eremomyces bilateralis CBS 781.70]